MLIQELISIEEKVTPLPAGMSIEDSFVELQKRIGAAKEAFGIVNKLKNKEQRRKHFSSVTGNMNTLRAQFKRLEKQLDDFYRAERDFELGSFREQD